MAVEFRANVEEDSKGGWCIRLSDITQNIEVICANIEEFSQNIEKMGDEYGGDINVIWSKNDDVTDEHFYELHQQMAKIKEELDT